MTRFKVKNVPLALAQLDKMTQNPEDLKFTLDDLNINEVNIILAGLQELPAKVCNPLTKKLTEQAEQQIAEFKEQNGEKSH